MFRRTLLLSLGAAALSLGAAQAQENYPNKPVSLVVPYAPGGPTDAMARTLAAALEPILGQPVIVENKAGAGANIGADYVARANPDGYTLLFGTSAPLGINSYLFPKLSYDPFKSFAPVIQIGHLPNVLLVNASVPANNMKELIAYAKANPGKLAYASSGNGASSHLTGALFSMRAGVDLQHVPYKGTGPALNDLLGGQIAMAFTDVLTALPHAQAGKLRILGVTSARRSGVLPDTPTLAEQGLKDFDSSVFFGIVAPAKTPPAVIAKLNAGFAAVLQSPSIRQKLSGQGLESPVNYTAAQLATYMHQEAAKWKEVIRVSGASLD